MTQVVPLTRNVDLDDWPAGQYRRTRVQLPPGFSAVITCPACGERGSLHDSHDVHADGTVQPSVVCPCGFHAYITLEGYADA